MPKPNLSEVPSYYHNYVSLVQEDDLIKALEDQSDIINFLKSIPEEKWNYRYAENKWSIKEMIQHIIDAERIFCYRALCFARKDQTPLPSFNENEYARNSKADMRSKDDLIGELKAVQQTSLLFFSSLDAEQLANKGVANNNLVSVNAIAYLLIGHTKHHINILNDRYL
ncbi:MAG TPA: DinB family protein [Chitinophagaceae bacterium]|nr:DinB family protein [Chitinophagaceae bacterium]